MRENTSRRRAFVLAINTSHYLIHIASIVITILDINQINVVRLINFIARTVSAFDEEKL
jgi:hypothetical protein